MDCETLGAADCALAVGAVMTRRGREADFQTTPRAITWWRRRSRSARSHSAVHGHVPSLLQPLMTKPRRAPVVLAAAHRSLQVVQPSRCELPLGSGNPPLQDELPPAAKRSTATTTDGDERSGLRTVQSLKNKGDKKPSARILALAMLSCRSPLHQRPSSALSLSKASLVRWTDVAVQGRHQEGRMRQPKWDWVQRER